jgi:hypothetical protein
MGEVPLYRASFAPYPLWGCIPTQCRTTLSSKVNLSTTLSSRVNLAQWQSPEPRPAPEPGSGSRVGSRVSGSGFGVWGLGCGVQGLGFGIKGSGSGFGV